MSWLELVGSLLVAALTAWTAADCRVILRNSRWEQRRVRIRYDEDHDGWDFDAECDYAGLRMLAEAVAE